MKTSFKALLKVQSTPEAGGGLGKLKDHRERLHELRQPSPALGPSAGTKRPPGEPPAASFAPKRGAPAQNSASEDGQPFIPAATFAGSRIGYAYKQGAAGLGYYRDAAQPPLSLAVSAAEFFESSMPAPPNTASASDAASALPAASLPAGFFDNPREDPLNHGKKESEVSSTQRGERLRQELLNFKKAIEPEVQVAEAVDELEDEADADFRGAAQDREQEALARRVRAVRELVDAELQAARRLAPRAGGIVVAVEGDRAAGQASESEDESDLLIDWRAKSGARL